MAYPIVEEENINYMMKLLREEMIRVDEKMSQLVPEASMIIRN